MEQPINYLLSNNKILIQPEKRSVKSKYKKKKCTKCNKRRKPLDESHQICHVCYKIKMVYKYNPSGNNTIDDFIRNTQINLVKNHGKMEFVPYDQFTNVEFIAEGGFSKIYKATWIDGPVINYSNTRDIRKQNYTVVLKKLNNSNNTTSKELNELKVFYDYSSKLKNNNGYKNIGKYFGITQDPNSQDIMIIMPYYRSGDLINCITKKFHYLNWKLKLIYLKNMVNGLIRIHGANIVHRDLHSGNIFVDTCNYIASVITIGDLGISKSATETGDDNENYGIIPYMAPEIFQGQKYTKASDIYSFGMIMWELITGRRPFWDRNHDTELIIDICDGLRPPIVTNAPKGYIKLMEECWHTDLEKRPSATNIYDKLDKIHEEECRNYNNNNPTEIIKSSDIGPVTINNPSAIYKSRPLSAMINPAMSLMSSRSQSINLEKVKRRFKDDLIEDNNDNGQSIKRKKLYENNDYLTIELELDIEMNLKSSKYITKEIDFDIDV
ncbi:uncharacterized protein OCT59_021251 [Rhizophagus irregularis]|nr:hypothetical protein OCT59_021251 [Rhizophagus irregularis]